MRKILSIALAALLAVSASGCANNSYGNKQNMGTVLGAIGGALLGSEVGDGDGQLAAVAAGTFFGALLGSEIGRSLDKADRMYAQQAVNRITDTRGVDVGDSIRWNNRRSGNRGVVEVTRDGYSRNGSYCREYQHTIVIAGETQKAYGIACQQPDGSWRIS